MGYINVVNITWEQGVSKVADPFSFTVQFECLKKIENEDIEWKFIYVGDSHDAKHDQILDSICMEDIDFGANEFTWEADTPNYALVPDQSEILDSTIIMVEAYYNNSIFFRCSYLIRHFYPDQELADNPPDNVNFEKLNREILVNNPIVTLYELAWKNVTDSVYNTTDNVDTEHFKNINMLEDDEGNTKENREKLLKQLENGTTIVN